ncbi:TPA: type II secretion system minor pseudopilin GspH [Pseudomonas aeruginosa]|uniref:type II secretion system minor pseudopilin GspH n=1 Tax=Pseudomonas aeruginosa TaxID=287 RepID=UPI0040361CB1
MRASRGFTLIELMVVMVIISVLIGLAVLSTGFASTSRELDSEAERLAGLIGVLTDEAVLDNREYGRAWSAMPIRYCATTKRRRAGCRWRATATACQSGRS